MRRDGVQRASTTIKRCPMADDVCAAKVAEHVAKFYGPGFDAMALIEEQCGRFTSGKSAGKLRGWAEIEVVTTGGWKKTAQGEGHGFVARPGRVLSIRISDFSGKTYLEVR
jgi:hypothetical protein